MGVSQSKRRWNIQRVYVEVGGGASNRDEELVDELWCNLVEKPAYSRHWVFARVIVRPTRMAELNLLVACVTTTR